MRDRKTKRHETNSRHLLISDLWSTVDTQHVVWESHSAVWKFVHVVAFFSSTRTEKEHKTFWRTCNKKMYHVKWFESRESDTVVREGKKCWLRSCTKATLNRRTCSLSPFVVFFFNLHRSSWPHCGQRILDERMLSTTAFEWTGRRRIHRCVFDESLPKTSSTHQ